MLLDHGSSDYSLQLRQYHAHRSRVQTAHRLRSVRIASRLQAYACINGIQRGNLEVLYTAHLHMHTKRKYTYGHSIHTFLHKMNRTHTHRRQRVRGQLA